MTSTFLVTECNIELTEEYSSTLHSSVTIDTKVERVRKKRNVFERAANAVNALTGQPVSLKKVISKTQVDQSHQTHAKIQFDRRASTESAQSQSKVVEPIPQVVEPVPQVVEPEPQVVEHVSQQQVKTTETELTGHTITTKQRIKEQNEDSSSCVEFSRRLSTESLNSIESNSSDSRVS